ncbi:MAG: hypothetical protein D6716_12315 [Chloroflexi bacterium]|nr:MAG: hypothetical protein D6716_12315 [Chloroflexota bacterium]
MAAALQTTPHADDKRSRQPIQRVMAPEIVIRARQYNFNYEISSRVQEVHAWIGLLRVLVR